MRRVLETPATPPRAAAVGCTHDGGRVSGSFGCQIVKELEAAVAVSALQKQKARRHRCDPGSCANAAASANDTSTRICRARIDVVEPPRIR
jgi:hypothetical protein